MPGDSNSIDPSQAAYVAGASSLLGTGINAVAAASASRAGRKWADKTYAKQRADNLADWHMQNEYNSPEMQMRRLKQAGLNPNLVYGQGAVANSTSAPKPADTQNWQPVPIRVDASGIGEAINTYFNVQQAQQDILFKKQQTDNLRKQQELMDLDKNLKTYQAIESFVRGEKGKLDLSFGKDTYDDRKNWWSLKNYQTQVNTDKTEQEISQSRKLFPYMLDIKRQTIKNMKNDIFISNQKNNRANQMQPYNINSVVTTTGMNAARTLLIQAQTETEPLKRQQLIAQAKNIMAGANKVEYENFMRSTYGIDSGSGLTNTFLRQTSNVMEKWGKKWDNLWKKK